MPQTLTEFSASSLLEAIKTSLTWTTAAKDGGTFWFRGVNDAAFGLEPGAYWRNDYEETRPLLDLVQEGRAYAEVGEMDDWRTYYFAQHHGIPTRLLDWTESFSAALFFALDNWDGNTTPCVWIVRPECINEVSTGWPGIITPEQNKELDLWLPRLIREGSRKMTTQDGKWVYDSRNPLAIYPRKTNSRIVAQQGTFTVHGTERVKLDEWIINSVSNHDKILCRILLKNIPKEPSLAQLTMLGTKRQTMYPDIINFVAYLRDCYKW